MNATDKKHNKPGKWNNMVQQFKNITSEIFNYIIVNTHREFVWNDNFHLNIEIVYIINNLYLKDKSFPFTFS